VHFVGVIIVRRISISSGGIEPAITAIKRLYTYVLVRTAIGIGQNVV
jgi:hypothetical protein